MYTTTIYKSTLHLLTWLFYGLYDVCSFKVYVHHKEFIGPPRRTFYQECMESLDRMKERLDE